MVRPKAKDHIKSYVVQWRGNKPRVEPSTWAPGYTPGYKNTEQEAIAMEMVALMQHISDFREKWLQLNLLAEQHRSDLITETDDPLETMTMPEGAISVDKIDASNISANNIRAGDSFYKDLKWNHIGMEPGYDDHQDH